MLITQHKILCRRRDYHAQRSSSMSRDDVESAWEKQTPENAKKKVLKKMENVGRGRCKGNRGNMRGQWAGSIDI